MKALHIRTVLGPVAIDEIGVTLPHEHLLVDLIDPYFTPPNDERSGDAFLPFKEAFRERAVIDCNAFEDNLRLDDTELAVAELAPFAAAGGSAIVELSSTDIGRNPAGLRDISCRTGIHVVMGCGYYIDRSQPARARAASVEDLADEMTRDVLEGVPGTGVCSGIIGEIGVDAQSEQERKVLQAAAEAQRRTGASINVHVEFIMGGASAGYWARDVLGDAGADMSRLIFSHQDSSHEDRAYQEALLEAGIVIEYDGFGYEMTTSAYGGLSYPSDGERIAAIASLITAGWERQLLISSDICMKFLLSAFGGHGYAHVLESVVPRMRQAGVSESAIRAMLIETPRRLLAIRDRERDGTS